MTKIKGILFVFFIFFYVNNFSQIVVKKWDKKNIEFPIYDSNTIVNYENNYLKWQNDDSLQLSIKIFDGFYFNNCREVVEKMIVDEKITSMNLKAVSQKEFVGANGFNCYYYKGTAIQNNKKIAFNIYGFYDAYEFKNMAACFISSKNNISDNFYYQKFIELSDNYLKTIKKIN